MSVYPGMENVVIRQMETFVVLPEGSSEIEARVPYAAYKSVQKRSEHRASYLDVGLGRPVLVFTMENLTPEMDDLMHVEYSFSSLSMFREPFLLVAAFSLMMAAAVLFSRVSIKIKND
jgi:hypothetical protein